MNYNQLIKLFNQSEKSSSCLKSAEIKDEVLENISYFLSYFLYFFLFSTAFLIFFLLSVWFILKSKRKMKQRKQTKG